MPVFRRLILTLLVLTSLLALASCGGNGGDDRLNASGTREATTQAASVPAGAVTPNEVLGEAVTPTAVAESSPEPSPEPRPTFAPTATAVPAWESAVSGREVPIVESASGPIPQAAHEELIVGTGSTVAEADSRLLVEYAAFLAEDGAQFDSTWNVPGTVTLDLEVLPLPALASELVGVVAGERRQIALPGADGYGASGLGDLVPPNADLVFVVDVARVEHRRLLADEPSVEVPGQAVEELSTTDLQDGSGPAAVLGDRVSVHFVARFADSGDRWESTWTSGFSTAFTLGQGSVIRGFEEGIVGMAAGGRRIIEVPANMAFGTEGAPDRGVAGGQSFVFIVDLLELGESAGR